ncbi:hypothetical protein DMN91_008404 [Ooceraea biroi]|uniref:Uncharacterized protein n=1 Tax=Ooceraea biroi TaxID=2015173 RepID=A0A3L8DHC0_OOCBI|nr:hypothetical protein DMN91_008404 [Ooceraea biroi]
MANHEEDKSESSEMEVEKEGEEPEDPDKILVIDPNSEVCHRFIKYIN